MAWLGNLLVFGAVICEASYAVIGKKLTGVLGPRRITALINLWGFALVTPFGLYMAWRFDFHRRAAGHLAAAGVLFAGGQRVDGMALDDGLKVVPAAQGGVFTVMLPVSAALVGVLVLGESLGPAAAGRFRHRAGGRGAGHAAGQGGRYFPVTLRIAGLMFSRRAGSTVAFSRGAFSTMDVGCFREDAELRHHRIQVFHVDDGDLQRPAVLAGHVPGVHHLGRLLDELDHPRVLGTRPTRTSARMP
jgi:hypothetical protein